MTYTKRFIISLIFYFIVSFGVSLTVIAQVGVASVNAFASTLSEVTSIRIGHFIIGVNTFFSIVYAFITHFKYKTVFVIQVASILFLGTFVNFFVYTFFKDLLITSYLLNIMILVLGIIITAVSVSVVTVLHTITFSIESTCYELEKRHVLSFFKSRVLIDVFFIVLSIIFYVSFDTTLYIREGTLLSMFLFSFIMKLSMRTIQSIIKNKNT